MAPMVHGLEAQYHGRVNFVYLDIDDPANQDFLQTLGFVYQPHIILLDADGHILEQWVGPVGEAELVASLDAALIN
jgi:thioredoxin-like negative regulator of GroEL